MAIVTISRGSFSGGEALAYRLGDFLEGTLKVAYVPPCEPQSHGTAA